MVVVRSAVLVGLEAETTMDEVGAALATKEVLEKPQTRTMLLMSVAMGPCQSMHTQQG